MRLEPVLRRLALLLAVWVFCRPVPLAFAAEAAPSPPARIGLDHLTGELLENNPEIKSARERWEASKAVVPQARTLPDPRFNVGYTSVAERETAYGVSQEIPFPGKLGLRGKIAARQAERVEQEYLATRLRVVAQLKQAYYDLHFVHTSIDIIGKNKLILMSFEKTAEARYQVGQATQQDILRAQTEISRVLARIATLVQKRESLQADINRLLNRPPADPLGTPEEIRLTSLTRNLAELSAMLDQSAPLLRAQLKSVEQGDQAIALAKREYFPDFEVEGGGVRNETFEKSGYQILVGIKVPLYFFSKQRYGVREARAGREAAAQDLRAVKQDLLFRVKDGVVQVKRAEELIAILKDGLLPQARLTLEASKAGYQVGKVDFLTLLNSLLTLQENELELHGEMAEHEKAVARLEEIIGEAP